MKVAVIGGGGREHAIIRKLKENPQVTARSTRCPAMEGSRMTPSALTYRRHRLGGGGGLCSAEAIDFAVVAPDDPLCPGDGGSAGGQVGIPAFGPTAKAAQIESSKVFAKG